MLVADPDAKAWDEFRQALGEGWIVVGAASSDAAMAEAQKQPFDVAVANYNLPGPGAIELLDQLRAAHPKDTAALLPRDSTLKEQVYGVLMWAAINS